ncbi:MAG: RNA polymerase factor sigma-54 [Firmicutes bacterium]|nr:RNA polymerase factor sigma-54 [Bacillota bacterium]
MRQKLVTNVANVQGLVFTPKLRQALTILQLPAYELATYLQQELTANPVLELELPWEELTGEDPYQDPNTQTQEWLEYWFQESVPRSDIPQEQKKMVPADRWPALGQDKLQELVLQIRTSPYPPPVQELAVQLLEYLDPSGFLPSADCELAQATGMPVNEVAAARQLLQSLEPRGIGCRNLAEYFCLQLADQGQLQDTWKRAIEEFLPMLAAGQVAQVAAALQCQPKEMQELLDCLQRLTPRPGGQLSSGTRNQFVLPDVIVLKEMGTYQVNINERALPRLALNRYYVNLLSTTRDAEVARYIRDRITAATWLMRSLQQRQQTLYNVALAIVAGQDAFLEEGISRLRPLTLAQVAASLGIHESTVSRAVAGKYMQTPQGMYPMRFFFTSGVADSSGLGLAKEGVQAALRQLIEQEDATAPWSDQELADLLQKQGIVISRRTVGKYREEMGILSSRGRKKYYM